MEQLLMDLGLPGLMIAGLVWAYRAERTRADAERAGKDAVQEARIEDYRETVAEVTKALQALTAALEAGEK